MSPPLTPRKLTAARGGPHTGRLAGRPLLGTPCPAPQLPGDKTGQCFQGPPGATPLLGQQHTPAALWAAWPRALPDWPQPDDTKVGVACADLGGRRGGRGLCRGRVGRGAQRVCSLLVTHPPGACFSSEGFTGPLFQSLKQTSSRRGNQGSERTTAFLRPQAGSSLPACLCRAPWVGPPAYSSWCPGG